MTIAEPSRKTIDDAVAGRLSSVDQIIVLIQPGIFNLSVRMLGNREDAADATQEILLKVITHRSTFRSDSAFATWVFRVAKNHLLTTLAKTQESPEVSLDGLYESLEAGLALNEGLAQPFGGRTLQPDEKLEAKQIALGCTQKMLMSLDRNQRLSYVLDVVFGLSSVEAAAVLEISSDSHRQRVARARSRLDAFAATTCGLSSTSAKCSCDKQIPAVRQLRSREAVDTGHLMSVGQVEQSEVQRNFDALVRLGEASALIKAHPDYQAPQSMSAAIRSVLRMEGLFTGPPSLK
jgi:RNA polymerase sigma factor (sigma-70 family)